MRFYAAVSGKHDAVVESRYPHVLVSFALDPGLAILDEYTPASVMIDSGAFTEWTKGHTVDVDAYGEWATGTALRLTMKVGDVRFINLDVIPGEPGRKPTEAEVTTAAYASMRNADTLRVKHGLKIMEVFHYGEPPDVLDAILARRQVGEVVGLGGSVGVEHRERTRWLDEVWAHVFEHHASVASRARGGRGVAALRAVQHVPPLHGLGTSNEDLSRRYPWWSVDSSSYTIPHRFGRTLNARGRQEFMSTSGGTVTRRAAPAQRIEATRILRRWQRLERDMTRAWDRRGIRCLP